MFIESDPVELRLSWYTVYGTYPGLKGEWVAESITRKCTQEFGSDRELGCWISDSLPCETLWVVSVTLKESRDREALAACSCFPVRDLYLLPCLVRHCFRCSGTRLCLRIHENCRSLIFYQKVIIILGRTLKWVPGVTRLISTLKRCKEY